MVVGKHNARTLKMSPYSGMCAGLTISISLSSPKGVECPFSVVNCGLVSSSQSSVPCMIFRPGKGAERRAWPVHPALHIAALDEHEESAGCEGSRWQTCRPTA